MYSDSPAPNLIEEVYNIFLSHAPFGIATPDVLDRILRTLASSLEGFTAELQTNEKVLRVLPFLIFSPPFNDFNHPEFIQSVCALIASLPPHLETRFVEWIARYPKSEISSCVSAIHFLLGHIVENKALVSDLTVACKTVKLFFDASQIVRVLPFSSQKAVSFEVFYFPLTKKMELDSEMDKKKENKFSFCNYLFFFPPECKSELLQHVITEERCPTFKLELVRYMLTGNGNPFFELPLRRENLIYDALTHVCLLTPLSPITIIVFCLNLFYLTISFIYIFDYF